MKRLSILAGFLVLLLACEKEMAENFPVPLPEEELIPVSFQPIIKEGKIGDFEIVPMNSAEVVDNTTIKTILDKKCHIVLVKYIAPRWVIDTTLIVNLSSGYQSLKVTDDTEFSPIRFMLRPGKYKAGFFLNATFTKWNQSLKPGLVVAEREDIQPKDRDLPPAFTYAIQSSTDYQDYQQVMCRYEIFACWKEFTVQKNSDVQTPGIPSNTTLQFLRRSAHFRFLMTTDTVTVGEEKRFFRGNTAITLNADFTVPAETPFCQGLNILGGGYFPKDSICTRLTLYITTYGDPYKAKNDKYYSMGRQENSTYYNCNIMMDDSYPDGLDCTLRNIAASQADTDPTFRNDTTITLNIKRGHVQGVAFRPSPKSPWKPAEYRPGLYMEEAKDLKVSELFHPYYELN